MDLRQDHDMVMCSVWTMGEAKCPGTAGRGPAMCPDGEGSAGGEKVSSGDDSGPCWARGDMEQVGEHTGWGWQVGALVEGRYLVARTSLSCMGGRGGEQLQETGERRKRAVLSRPGGDPAVPSPQVRGVGAGRWQCAARWAQGLATRSRQGMRPSPRGWCCLARNHQMAPFPHKIVSCRRPGPSQSPRSWGAQGQTLRI